jgi:hypothetical protein
VTTPTGLAFFANSGGIDASSSHCEVRSIQKKFTGQLKRDAIKC